MGLRAARVIFCGLAFTALLVAEKQALLVGVSKYQSRRISSLDGPAYDVSALAKLLRKTYTFDHITTLVDDQATRSNILDAVSDLVRHTKRDDYIFVYFSGHGTSAAAGNAQALGLSLGVDTGALVPYDVEISPPARLMATLIVGNRDLRPLFTTLDKTGAEVWIVFDSCFSERAVRNVLPLGAPSRYLKIDSASAQTNRDFTQEDVYPYEHIVYNSAAGFAEPALDISEIEIRKNPHLTIDAKPHGAFTNALLDGLTGLADSNHDGRITYQELHAYAAKRVKHDFGHTPQLFPSDPSAVIVRRYALGGGSFGRRREENKPLRLLVEGDVPPLLANGISSISGLVAFGPQEPETTGYDLRLRRRASTVQLIHHNGTILKEFALSDSSTILEQIRRHAALQQLLAFRPSDPTFNVWLSTDPPNRGVWFDGDTLSVVISSEKTIFPLLLSVDTQANVFVLYPMVAHSNISIGTTLRLPDLGRIQAPLGLERLFLCGFTEEPSDYLRWADISMSPLDKNFAALMGLIRDGCVSQAGVMFTTAAR